MTPDAASLRVLIGIDDTDNFESPGTGFIARQLGRLLVADEMVSLDGITRHQLLVDPRIRYTSHNSSLCLDARVRRERMSGLVAYCRDYLARESAPGSDAGLCVVAWDATRPAVEVFGQRAKREVVTQEEARAVAAAEGILLEGVTGDHGGIIGALAAVGLRRGDRDGRFAWRPGLRERSGIVAAGELLDTTGIDAIRSLDGAPVKAQDKIDVGRWPRPVLIEGQAILLVERDTGGSSAWRLAPKELIKQY